MGATGDVTDLAVLPAKIDRPRRRHGNRPRPHLVEALERSEARCVLVAAPAGYGKTTFVREWTDAHPRSTAWVTADPSDADPTSFLRAVVAALGPVAPVGPAVALFDDHGPPAAEAVMAAVGAALAAVDAPVHLIVDDAHELSSAATVEILEQLLDAVPDGSRIVLAGRQVPPLRVERRRLAEPVLEIGTDDLAFDADESAAVVREVLGDEVADDLIAELHDRTEGWPAGLQLAVLALAHQPDPGSALRGLVAGGGHLADYVRQELLAGVSADERRFLLHTSVLTRLDAALCDTVTADECGVVHLDRLVHAGNLFIVPLERPDTFRYHHLFGELLLGELRRTEPHLEAVLRRRAAERLLQEGDGEGAFRQAMATGDLDLAERVVFGQRFESVARGSGADLERWLAELPPEEVRRRHPLLVANCWVAINNGRVHELDELLALLDRVDDDRPLPDGTASLAVAVAAVRVVGGRDGVKATATHAETVIAAGPNGSPWWGMAHMRRAVALHLAGADDDPLELFDAAERATAGEGAVHAITLAHCGLVRLQRDDPDGYDLIERAVAERARSGAEALPLAAMVSTALAYAEAKRGRIEASLAASLAAGEQISIVCDALPGAEAHHRVILAEAALLRRDLPEAARQLTRVEELLPWEPEAVLLHEWAERVARRTSARRRADGDSEWSQLSAAELRVLEQLPTHRSLEEIGHHLYVSRNTVKSHTVSIYRKLGVSGRSPAVKRAIELGLLSE